VKQAPAKETRAKAFTFRHSSISKNSRILTTEDTEITEENEEKVRKLSFSVVSVISVVKFSSKI
jgi:hypothetical protein